MKFKIDYPVSADHDRDWMTPASMARFVQAVEEMGFDGLGFTDHPAPSAKWLDHGGHATLDPFSALGFCAAVTDRITLFTHLLVVPYRNPLLQASAMASVDVLSGGRSIFVLGAGYLRSEFAALGVDFEERNALFDESLDVVTRYSRGETFSYRGRHFEAVGQRIAPRPVQRPHAPLWIGGNSSKALDRVAAHGSGWSVMWGSATLAKTARTRQISDIDQLAETITDLEKRVAQAGRSIDEISISTSAPAVGPDSSHSPARQVEQVQQLAQLGVRWVHVAVPDGGVDDCLARLQQFASEVMTPCR